MTRRKRKGFGSLSKFETNDIKRILNDNGIMGMGRPDYLKFASQLKARVVKRGGLSKEEVLEEYIRKYQLRRDILEKIASFLKA